MSCDHLVEVNIADFALNDYQFKECQLILENNYCVVKLLKEKLHFRSEGGNNVDWPFVDDEKGNSNDGGGNNVDTFFI